MKTISKNYAVEWQLDFAKNYVWTKQGQCFNSKTNMQIRKSIKNRCIGYYIEGKFYSLKKLRQHLEKIKRDEAPF